MNFDIKLAAQQLRARMGVPYSIDEMADGIEKLKEAAEKASRALFVAAQLADSESRRSMYLEALEACEKALSSKPDA